jgi:hypothetical protein
MAKKKPDDASATDPKPYTLVGHTIAEVRRMTSAEMKNEDWGNGGRHGAPVTLVLDDGTKLYPSRDPEGNGPGAMFGTDAQGQTIRFG